MKKIVIALVLLLLVSGAVFAQDQEGPVRFDSSTGIYYDAYADVHLGDFLALRAYGGGICLGAIGSSMVVTVAPEAGARLSLGGLYAEASYVFADSILPRYGIGFTASF